MHVLFIQFSGLIGLLIFLSQLWTHEPLDETLFKGCVAGMVVYFALILGEVTIRRILAQRPPSEAEEAYLFPHDPPDAPAEEAPDRKAPEPKEPAEAVT